MSGGVVDRTEWAKLVGELLDEIPRRNKAELARRIGLRERTIDRWLARQVDVAEGSVRQVADRTGRNAMELLIRVGFYRREQLPAPAIPPEDQWIVDQIRASKLSVTAQNAMIAVQLERARRERDERKRQIEEEIGLIGSGNEEHR